MKNFIQAGNNLDLTAPSGGVLSGGAYLIGGLFGVAAITAAEGDTFAMSVTGCYMLPKATGAALSEGQKAYWAGTEISGTASGNTLIGHIIDAAGSSAVEVKVRLSN